MLANAYIPVFAVAVGAAMACLGIALTLVVEATAVHYGRFRDSARSRRRARVGLRPPLRTALLFAFVANAASTLPGIASVYLLRFSSLLPVVSVHYLITVAIEIPIYAWLGMRLTPKLIAAILFANMLTYAMMFIWVIAVA